jgi:hypothetical protein
VGRDFFDSTYNVVKHLNPTLPYMVRPWPGDSPSVVIEFDYGEKAQVPLVGLSREALERKVRTFFVFVFSGVVVSRARREGLGEGLFISTTQGTRGNAGW